MTTGFENEAAQMVAGFKEEENERKNIYKEVTHI